MSNANIVRGILDACDRFERKEITLADLGLAIEGHGSALEGLDRQQESQIREFCNQLEEIEFETLCEQQYGRARQVVIGIRSFFSQWLPETRDP